MWVILGQVHDRWRVDFFELLKAEFPDASEEDHRRKFAEITLGSELAGKVFGPLPDSVSRKIEYDPDDVPRYAYPEDFILAMLNWYQRGKAHHWDNVIWLMRSKGNRLEIDYMRRWAGELDVSDLLERALSEAA